MCSSLLILLVLAACLALVPTTAFLQQRQHSLVNQKFRTCCEQRLGENNWCAQRFCNFDRVTPLEMVTDGRDCLHVASQIWNCATGTQDHQSCCRKNGVFDDCLNYCNGKLNLNLKNPNYACMLHFYPIRQCFEEEFVLDNGTQSVRGPGVH